MGTNDADDFVTVQVPRRHYKAVITALANEMNKTRAGKDSARSSRVAWSSDEIGRLKHTINVTGRAVMELAARQPGEWISFEQVIERASQSGTPRFSGV